MRFGPLTKVHEIRTDRDAERADLPALVDEPMPNAVDLGWHYSDGKHEVQMAKIPAEDLATHMYVIGASGSGKTKFLEFLIQQDLADGRGFAVIDPHGDLAEDIKGFFAWQHRNDERALREDIVLIDPTDPTYTAVFNPLERQPGVSSAELAGELISSFSRIWANAWGVRMEDLMRHSLIALAEADRTLADLPAFLTSNDDRRAILSTVEHPGAIEYFKRFDAMTDRAKLTWVEPVLNKVNALLADERVRAFFSGQRSTFHLRGVMDEGKALIVKLDRGRLHDSADLLGSLLLAKLKMAAFSRSNVSTSQRRPFTLYVDEFQNYASDSFGSILSEARKYGLQLVMAHQTLAQVSRELRSVILGNAGLQVFFRVSRSDAETLAKEAFELPLAAGRRGSAGGWERYVQELQTLPPRGCWVKHQVEGGILPLTTVQIESPAELFGKDEAVCREILSAMPIGAAYLVERASLAPRALVVPQATLTPGELPTPARGALDAAIARATSQADVPEPLAAASPPDQELVSYLRDIAEHPFAPALERDQRLDLSRYKGNLLRQRITEADLATLHRVSTGTRSGQLALLELTGEGEQVLASVKVTVRHPRGRGGFLHRYYQHRLAEYAQRTWPDATVEIESRVPGSGRYADVAVRPKSDDTQTTAFEVFITGEAKEIRGLTEDLKLFTRVILCAETPEAIESLKARAADAIPASDLQRVTFSVIGPYLAAASSSAKTITAVQSQPSKTARSVSTKRTRAASTSTSDSTSGPQPSLKQAPEPEAEPRKRAGRKPKTAFLLQVRQAYEHIHDLDWLDESPLVELEAVAERANPLNAMPRAQSLRGILVEAAQRLARQMADVPERAPLKVFLERYIEGKRIQDIAEELGVSREWCSRSYKKQALELAVMQFVRLVSSDG